MGRATGDFLPSAVGVAISPLPIVAVVLMLVTPRGRVDGPVFLVGWLVGSQSWERSSSRSRPGWCSTWCAAHAGVVRVRRLRGARHGYADDKEQGGTRQRDAERPCAPIAPAAYEAIRLREARPPGRKIPLSGHRSCAAAGVAEDGMPKGAS